MSSARRSSPAGVPQDHRLQRLAASDAAEPPAQAGSLHQGFCASINQRYSSMSIMRFFAHHSSFGRIFGYAGIASHEPFHPMALAPIQPRDGSADIGRGPGPRPGPRGLTHPRNAGLQARGRLERGKRKPSGGHAVPRPAEAEASPPPKCCRSEPIPGPGAPPPAVLQTHPPTTPPASARIRPAPMDEPPGSASPHHPRPPRSDRPRRPLSTIAALLLLTVAARPHPGGPRPLRDTPGRPQGPALARPRPRPPPGPAQRLLRRRRVRAGQGPPDPDRAPRRPRLAQRRRRPPHGEPPRRLPVGDPARHHPHQPRPRLDRRARLRLDHRAGRAAHPRRLAGAPPLDLAHPRLRA